MNLFDKMDHAPTLKQRLQGETNVTDFMPYHVRVPGRESFRHHSLYLTPEERNKQNKARAKRKANKKARKASRARK